MSRDGVIFGVAGTVFGLLLGWIIGSQQGPVRPAAPATTSAGAGSSTPAVPGEQARPIDLQRAADLEKQARAQPSDVVSRVQLGNLYQDGQRPDLAIPWYEAAYKLNPRDVNVSTDLAVCYYYTEQPDKALAQIDKSLAIDPRHPPTLLNQGIIRAWGKQDLQGALESWQKVVQVAPGSPEAARAKEGIDGLQSAHGRNQPGGGRGGL
ncbi:MAG TPA: tetratricopeptide repeat protein [Vicinamibacterales bacterium]|nr:tetratricopeptide repeat protein [Vicinamibacterales bacterium]